MEEINHRLKKAMLAVFGEIPNVLTHLTIQYSIVRILKSKNHST